MSEQLTTPSEDEPIKTSLENIDQGNEIETSESNFRDISRKYADTLMPTPDDGKERAKANDGTEIMTPEDHIASDTANDIYLGLYLLNNPDRVKSDEEVKGLVEKLSSIAQGLMPTPDDGKERAKANDGTEIMTPEDHIAVDTAASLMDLSKSLNQLATREK